VIGFDWHSSGLTTTTTGALKESINALNLNIKVAGGKGKTSRKTPQDIQNLGYALGIGEKKIQEYTKASRLSAKVDNALVQDGYQLYHHAFFFTKKGWAVVQQGLNNSAFARRYHWLSSSMRSFVNEPHNAIISDTLTKSVLNLTAKEVEETRSCSLDLIKENPSHLKKYLNTDYKNYSKTDNKQMLLTNYLKQKDNEIAAETSDEIKTFTMAAKHFPKISANMKALLKAYEQQPQTYEELVEVKGMGAQNLCALALISHLVHGSPLSWKDPCKYSFAHGGKDGWPYPVHRETFQHSIEFLDSAIRDAKVNNKNKVRALRRLHSYYQAMLVNP
jgi:hypothetical protein